MKIERIYIACYKRGLHLTRCCVASIRHWYPQLPISLIKDEIDGPYDTSDMQQYWDVDVLRTRKHRFGRGMSKFEALTLPGRERCLILDNDIVFLGRVIDRLECFDEDFIVASHGGPPEEFEAHYFDQRLLKQIDRQFKYRGGAFNTGQFVATTGILELADLAEHLTAKEPRTAARPDIFQACEQGLVNYLLLKRWQEGSVSLRHDGFMWWSEWLEPSRVAVEDLQCHHDLQVLLHWAGPKPATIGAMRHAEILRFFHDLYFSRLPAAMRQRIEQSANAASRREQRLRAAALKVLHGHADS